MELDAARRDLWSSLLRLLHIHYCALRSGLRGVAAGARLVAYDMAALLASLGVKVALFEKNAGGLRLLVACPIRGCVEEPRMVVHEDGVVEISCCDGTSYTIGREYCS